MNDAPRRSSPQARKLAKAFMDACRVVDLELKERGLRSWRLYPLFGAVLILGGLGGVVLSVGTHPAASKESLLGHQVEQRLLRLEETQRTIGGQLRELERIAGEVGEEHARRAQEKRDLHNNLMSDLRNLQDRMRALMDQCERKSNQPTLQPSPEEPQQTDGLRITEHHGEMFYEEPGATRMRLLRTYESAARIGYVLEIENISSDAIRVDPKQFKMLGMIDASVMDTILAPPESKNDGEAYKGYPNKTQAFVVVDKSGRLK